MGKFPYIAIILLIALASSCGCISDEEENTPESAVATYYRGLNERNAEMVLSTLADSVIDDAGGEKAIMAALNETMNDLQENNLVFEIDTIATTIRGYKATVELQLKMYPKGTQDVSLIPYTFELITERGIWKIQDIG